MALKCQQECFKEVDKGAEPAAVERRACIGNQKKARCEKPHGLQSMLDMRTDIPVLVRT